MSQSEQALLGVIGDIYEAAIDPASWEHVCRRLAAMFGATGFALQINNTETREMPLYITAGIDPAAAAAYVEEIAKADPRVLYSRHQPAGAPHHDYLFITEQEMRRHPYYDFLAQWGFRYYCAGVILRDGPLIGNASFQRAPKEGPTSAADVDLMQRLLPHLGRAVQVGTRLHTLERHKSAIEQFLEHAAFGAALLSSKGAILFLNREARKIAASGEGFSANSAGVQAARSNDNAALQRLIGGALAVTRGEAIAGGGSMLLSKLSGTGAYTILVSPLPRNESAFLTSYPAAIVVITDPRAAQPSSPVVLCTAFGLTPAEAAVAMALVEGKTVVEIARARGVSLRTVRAQLEAIFRKTGTARQADLVRQLLGLPSTS